jgi:hypothetical protein
MLAINNPSNLNSVQFGKDNDQAARDELNSIIRGIFSMQTGIPLLKKGQGQTVNNLNPGMSPLPMAI